jgi:MerR family transcriptional regulator, light-induced transcriptional regulator
MNSFSHTGSLHQGHDGHEGHEGPSFDRWSGDSRYPPNCEGGEPVATDALELRFALLAKAIENEIIPRLMLAHRADSNATPARPTVPEKEVSLKDIEDFSRLVMSSDDHLAQLCVEAMRARGVSVEAIYLNLLAPVAQHLGKLWDQDLCDFTEVTLGLGRLHRVLRELSPAFSPPADKPANCRRILLLPAPGEQHTFGLVMVAEFFRRAGWDVAGGPWEAGADPSVMVKHEWFDVVGFSLANERHLSELGHCIRAIRKSALNQQIGIMVGGPTFSAHPEFAEQVDADISSADGRTAPALAEKLAASQGRRAA